MQPSSCVDGKYLLLLCLLSILICNGSLLDRNHIVLPTIASVFPFEIAIGLNGRVWMKAETVGETLAMKRLIESVDDHIIPVEEKAIKEKLREYLS